MESVSLDPAVAVVDITAWLRLLQPDDPAAVFEVRIPRCPDRAGGSYRSTWAGYFQVPQIQAAAQAVARIDHDQQPDGIYVTLNPVRPELLARSINTIKPKADATTADADILLRRWLFLDLDPKRPAKVSATDAEMTAAIDLASRMTEQLAAEGWPQPIRCASGNGAYLLYRLELPNDQPTTDLIKRVLARLAARFNTDQVDIDQATFNAARIVKVMGTHGRKGDHLVNVPGLEDRPHRLARCLDVPPSCEVVTLEQLEQLAGPGGAPAPPASSPRQHQRAIAGSFDTFDHTAEGVQGYLERHGVSIARVIDTPGGTKLILEQCPITNIDGTDTSVAVIVGHDGLITFHNLHNRAMGLEWVDVRDELEPGYKDWRKAQKDWPRHPMGGEVPRPPIRTLDHDLIEAQTWLASQHGRPSLGLLTGTFAKLDERTMGLRGLILLASLPGIGKTSLGLQLGLDIVAHAYQKPDPRQGRVCFVFFSFEMARRAMALRVMARASGLPWAKLVLGESGTYGYSPDPDDGLRFSPKDRTAYARGIEQLEVVANRIVIIDGEDVPTGGLAHPATWLFDRIADAKTATESDRAFVLIDNLQAIPVWNDPAGGHAWRTDLDRDRFVMSELLKVSREISAGAVADAVMVISEQTKAGFGGSDMASVLGSGRSVYSPDVVMFLRPDPAQDEAEPTSPGETELDLVIMKARDGMTRGAVPLTFNHRITQFTENRGRAPFKRVIKPRKRGGKTER